MSARDHAPASHDAERARLTQADDYTRVPACHNAAGWDYECQVDYVAAIARACGPVAGGDVGDLRPAPRRPRAPRQRPAGRPAPRPVAAAPVAAPTVPPRRTLVRATRDVPAHGIVRGDLVVVRHDAGPVTLVRETALTRGMVDGLCRHGVLAPEAAV